MRPRSTLRIDAEPRLVGAVDEDITLVAVHIRDQHRQGIGDQVQPALALGELPLRAVASSPLEEQSGDEQRLQRNDRQDAEDVPPVESARTTADGTGPSCPRADGPRGSASALAPASRRLPDRATALTRVKPRTGPVALAKGLSARFERPGRIRLTARRPERTNRESALRLGRSSATTAGVALSSNSASETRKLCRNRIAVGGTHRGRVTYPDVTSIFT